MSIIYGIIMGPCSAVFTGLGIYVMQKKDPGNFWTGQEFKPGEIKDVKAYNMALGKMWIAFSVLMWIDTFLGTFMGGKIGGICLIASFVVGIPMLPAVYNGIYKKYYDPTKV